MKKHGKKYVDAAKKAPQGPVSVAEAVAFVKANAFAKFDESVELGMRMGCDPRKSDQMIRGTVSLPHGTGKDVRVVVFAGGAAAEAAKAAGAIEAGTDDLLLMKGNRRIASGRLAKLGIQPAFAVEALC